MTQKNLKIHTENILPIIKKWLYSDKDVFVRELIANACDALRKVQILRDQGVLDVSDADLKIELTIQEKSLTFADTGIGMTADEVEKYIAQVAFSGAEEFVEKYKTGGEIIGHFGLGFYSAYMVAEKVTLDTLSYQNGVTAALWTCDGSSTYTLDTGTRTTRGTTITLHLAPEESEYLDENRLRSILSRHCAFLPFPIFLNGVQINEKEPLWLKNPSACTETDYLDFFHTLYPNDPDPIFWIHLNVDFPFHLQGILYFPKFTPRFDASQANIKLFCSRVFVADSCKDLMPDYLITLRGALDSPDIPLNVSRSALQMDRTVRQLATHISKKVADRLAALYQLEREKFLQSWPDIELTVKLGALQEEKFYEKVKEFLVWKNTKQEWTTIEEYLTRHPDKLFYTADAHSPLLPLYNDHEVLIASSPIDSALLNYLERKHNATFQRIDATCIETGETANTAIADLCKSVLSLDVEAKSLASPDIPAFLLIDEQSRRMRDYFALSGQSPFNAKKTFVINTNNRLIASLPALQQKSPSLATETIRHLYDLSQLSQKEIDPSQIPDFITRSSKLLEELAKAAVETHL